MEKLDFEKENVVILLDAHANHNSIMDWLRDKLRVQIGDNDRVVFFFAGHRTTLPTVKGGETLKLGYIIPYGAEYGKYSQYIDMDELRRACSIIPAKHILIILDCCFSGVAAIAVRGEPLSLQSGAVDDAYLINATKRIAGQILTAGASDECVADSGARPGHSTFTTALLDGLEGMADRDRDYLITATELYTYVKRRVIDETCGQTPFFNNMIGS